MSLNEIVEIKTVQAGAPDQPIFAIMIAANVAEPQTLREFVAQLVEKFTLQRMISPPTTTHLLVSIRGETTAEAVKALWKDCVAADHVVGVLMGKMLVADVVRAGRTGPAVEQLSLLD